MGILILPRIALPEPGHVIYEGNSRNQIACDDNSAGGGLARYLLNVTQGVTYYFAVGSYDRSDGGNLTFDLGT